VCVSKSGDARSLSSEAQAALRERGVRMLLDGATHTQVAQAMGVALRTVAGWSARFQVGGIEGLRERRRGRRPGEQMALSEARQAEIVRLMKGRNPDQLQLEGVLWSRQAVKGLIEQRFGITLTRQAVGGYLRRWGVSAKKPQKRWIEQDPERVRAWIEQEYPAIQARARRERALVLFSDEMGVRAGQTAGLSYAPVGERAVVPQTGKRFSANVISAVGADGTLLFDVFQGSCDEIRFLDFCDKLLEHIPDRKIFVIVDNARFHKSQAIAYWLLDHPRLELFFLPPYAPELNPTELLNQDVHSHVARRRPSDIVKLVSLTVEYLATRTREIVHNYFKGEYVAYTLSPGTICLSP
jgi:transposase